LENDGQHRIKHPVPSIFEMLGIGARGVTDVPTNSQGVIALTLMVCSPHASIFEMLGIGHLRAQLRAQHFNNTRN
jgi:hypothetical protein